MANGSGPRRSGLFYANIVEGPHNQVTRRQTGNPQQILSFAVGALIFVGLASFLLALVGKQILDTPQSWDFTSITVFLGAIYLILARFVALRSKPALTLAVILYGLDTLFTLAGLLSPAAIFYVAALVVHIILLAVILRGFQAIDRLTGVAYSTHATKSYLPPLHTQFQSEVIQAFERKV